MITGSGTVGTETSVATVDPGGTNKRSPLGRSYWRFFAVAFFFDFGFGLYVFLFTLYLAQLGFSEKTIGLVAGALTVGSIAATIPVGLLIRRFGLRAMLLCCVVFAPLVSALRTFVLHPRGAIALAFLNGVALCSWVVCTPPTLARLTTEDNRTAGFSYTFAMGIGSGALSGVVGGYLPKWLQYAGISHQLTTNMQAVLLLACAIALLAVFPLLHLRLDHHRGETAQSRSAQPNAFLLRFLLAFAVWNLATGAFAPFSGVYLLRRLSLPLTSVGLLFSASQLLQVIGVTLAPLFLRKVGATKGIACLQFVTGAALCYFATAGGNWALFLYLAVTAFQYMCNPGMYSLVMSRTPDSLRSTASALQNVVSSCALAVAAAGSGMLITHFGYSRILFASGSTAVLAAMLFYALLREPRAALDPVPDRSRGPDHGSGSIPEPFES